VSETREITVQFDHLSEEFKVGDTAGTQGETIHVRLDANGDVWQLVGDEWVEITPKWTWSADRR
jgi:hypothetical protein